MSELSKARSVRKDFRWHLLTTVSVLTVMGSVFGKQTARADAEDEHPSVWIELGGQLEHLDGLQGVFAPPFISVDHTPNPIEAVSPVDVQKAARYGYGGEGKISFSPGGSDWSFSASLRYGRSNGARHSHQQSVLNFTQPGPNMAVITAVRYFDAAFKNSESHSIVDFMAGRDVGLGVFGRGGSSEVGLGIRYAQFSSKSNVDMNARPDAAYGWFEAFPLVYLPIFMHHQYTAHADASRSFRGVGPRVAWDASARLLDVGEKSRFTFDWGVNAALLFGRQKAKIHHHTTGINYYNHVFITPQITTYEHNGAPNRAHNILVPNVGGFAGVSFKFPNAKISAGYRADLYFGAMDDGIDLTRQEKVGFYGPFATISIGLP